MFGGGARLGERGWGADREAARRALLDERQERRKEDRAGGRGADAYAAEAALCVVRGIDQRPLALILTLAA